MKTPLRANTLTSEKLTRMQRKISRMVAKETDDKVVEAIQQGEVMGNAIKRHRKRKLTKELLHSANNVTQKVRYSSVMGIIVRLKRINLVQSLQTPIHQIVPLQFLRHT